MNLCEFTCLFFYICVLLSLFYNESQQNIQKISQTNIYGLKYPTNEEVVEVIRRQFLLEADTNPHLYHPIDVQRCLTEDWQIERFLLEKGTPEEAFKALVKSMRWKKSIGVHDRSGNYFPIEMLRIFGHELPSRDRKGILCVWSHSNVYRKIPEFDELIKQYSVYYYEKVDREAGNQGFITISNSKGTSFGNLDTGMARFSLGLMEHYPYGVNYACTVDMHKFFQPMIKGLRNILPEHTKNKMFIFNREELTKFIDIDVNEIPVSIGGKRPTIYDLSDNMRPLSQCKHLGFTDRQIKEFYSIYGFERNFIF